MNTDTTKRLSSLQVLKRRPRMLLALPAAIVGAAIMAACGSSGSSSPGSGVGPYGPAAPSAPAATAPAAGGAGLMVRHTSLGTILTDSQGFTVYAFEADKGTRSQCSGACAAAWPPVTTATAAITVTGAAKSLAGETTRPGGARQLTYAEHPLYRYTGDTSPGATSGQGLVVFGGRWDVLAPAGTEITGG
jgi:predicted lipoprotein with Yx(FWY)xxD motif